MRDRNCLSKALRFEGSGKALGVTRDGDIHVELRPPEKAVPWRSTDDPGAHTLCAGETSERRERAAAPERGGENQFLSAKRGF